MLNDFSYSVIIPTYYRPSLLFRALKSIKNQTIAANEVYIIDTHPIGKNRLNINKAKSFLKLNIIYLDSLKNKNALIARNYASNLSKSKYLAFLDDDDFWEKNYIQNVLLNIKKNKSKLNISEYKVVNLNRQKKFYFHIPEKIEIQELFRWNPGILCSNIVIDRLTFKKLNGFDSNILGSADKDILIKCIKKKIKYSVMKKGLVNWTLHENQWSQNNELILEGVKKFNKKYFSEMNLFSKFISFKKIINLTIKKFIFK